MNPESHQKELRFKSSSNILDTIKRFSATEKAIFGALVIIAILSALAMAASVSDIFKVEVPAEGGEMREGVIGLPRTINPVLAVTDVDRDLSNLVYAGLLRYDGEKLVPDMAESYSISEDGLTYDFKLRPEAKFHDGEALTADDVVFTVEKIQDSAIKSPRHADWANVSVNKISDHEVQFSLKQPYSPFISNAVVGILPKHIWQNVNDEQFIFSTYNIEPIGSGPYKISAINRDAGGIPTEYRLSAFEGVRTPNISKLDFVFFNDEAKALDALSTGKIDSLSAIPAADAVSLASNSGEAYEIISSPLPRIFSVFFNQSQVEAFKDKAVREALEMAIDRKQLISEVLHDYGVPLYGPLPPSLTAEDMKDDQSSTTAAIALLEKNGWKKNSDGIYEKKVGKTGIIDLSFNIYTADADELKATAEYLKKTWSALGAKVDIKVYSANDLYQNVIRNRKYDALLFGEQIGKDRDLYAFWHSSQRNAPGLNVSMYANSKADKLLEDIRSETNEKNRIADYAKLDQTIKEDLPAIFLYAPNFTYAVPKSLKGMALNSISAPSDRWNSVDKWYLKTEKVWKIFANSN